MFIGHYSAALALSAARPRAPLWSLFVAVQLVDFAWAGLVIAGVEKVRIIPGFLASSDLDLYYMPYTHSLPAAVAWSLAAGLAAAAVWRGSGKAIIGGAIGLATLSHWGTDLLVHAPDLALFPGGPKVGLGLWRSLALSQALEMGLLAAGFLVYLAATRPKGRIGAAAPAILFAAMAALQGYSHLAPAPASSAAFAFSGLAAYAALALAAGHVDLTRTTR